MLDSSLIEVTLALFFRGIEFPEKIVGGMLGHTDGGALSSSDGC